MLKGTIPELTGMKQGVLNKMKEQSCIFCRIVAGEVPSVKVWEDEKHIAILDIKPYAKGHILVIPKKHSEWVWDMEDKDYAEYMKQVKYLANVLRKSFDTQWVEEIIAGIGVSHSHIHLIPRKREDGLGEVPKQPLNPKPSEKEMEEIANKIIKEIKK
jgi:histidine triad (HIT) family protein